MLCKSMIELNIVSPFYVMLSWNINGYSDDIHSWLLSLTRTSRPDIIFLSETKRKEDLLRSKFSEFTDYNVIINVHTPSTFHGVAMLIRKDHTYQEIRVNFGIPVRSDNKCNDACSGRVISIMFNNKMYILGTYVPNSGRSDENKLSYRINIWDPAVKQYLELLRSNGPTIWMGDINVALDDIDVSNSKAMSRYAGFTPMERANLRSLLQSGDWVDIWRQHHPTDRSYTWVGSPHQSNFGMRLDNIIITKSLAGKIINSFIMDDCPQSSDHLPIGIYIQS